jgi:hypothetical protein
MTDLSEEVTSDQRPQENKETSHIDIDARVFGESKYKGSEKREFLA